MMHFVGGVGCVFYMLLLSGWCRCAGVLFSLCFRVVCQGVV